MSQTQGFQDSKIENVGQNLKTATTVKIMFLRIPRLPKIYVTIIN